MPTLHESCTSSTRHHSLPARTACPQVVRDVLSVAAHAASGLRHDPGVRALLRSLHAKASNAGASLAALGWRSPLALHLHALGGGRGLWGTLEEGVPRVAGEGGPHRAGGMLELMRQEVSACGAGEPALVRVHARRVLWGWGPRGVCGEGMQLASALLLRMRIRLLPLMRALLLLHPLSPPCCYVDPFAPTLAGAHEVDCNTMTARLTHSLDTSPAGISEGIYLCQQTYDC